jgi:hypothetical protein
LIGTDGDDVNAPLTAGKGFAWPNDLPIPRREVPDRSGAGRVHPSVALLHAEVAPLAPISRVLSVAV